METLYKLRRRCREKKISESGRIITQYLHLSMIASSHSGDRVRWSGFQGTTPSLHSPFVLIYHFRLNSSNVL